MCCSDLDLPGDCRLVTEGGVTFKMVVLMMMMIIMMIIIIGFVSLAACTVIAQSV
jgi:hypothetical protein